MQKSSKILAAAALVGFGAMVAGLTAVSDGSARGVDSTAGSDLAAERIAGAFAVANLVEAGAAGKGDLGAGCAGRQWPDVPAACLVADDGSFARPVRSVTLGTQVGDATTVLLRLPAPQVASR